jgi:hypothetical protein
MDFADNADHSTVTEIGDSHATTPTYRSITETRTSAAMTNVKVEPATNSLNGKMTKVESPRSGVHMGPRQKMNQVAKVRAQETALTNCFKAVAMGRLIR